MPPTTAERIRELEAELAELKGQEARPEARPFTLAEVRAMPREEVEAEWERVQATIVRAADEDAPTASERLRRGYGEARDGMEIYKERRNKA